MSIPRLYLYREDCPKGKPFHGEEAIAAAKEAGWHSKDAAGKVAKSPDGGAASGGSADPTKPSQTKKKAATKKGTAAKKKKAADIGTAANVSK